MKAGLENPFRRRSPLLAKLGVITLVSASLAGVGGTLYSTLNRQAAQFLGVAIGSAVSATLVTLWSLRYTGLLTYLPPQLEEPLLHWSVLQAIQILNASLDFEAAKLMAVELAPLVIAANDAETKRAITNMSTRWQKVFSTTGLLGLLPKNWQKIILPRDHPLIEPPVSIPENREADLGSQTELFRELAMLRIKELFNYLAENYAFFNFIKKAGIYIGRFHEFVKQNTSSDLQVTVIMSVMALLIFRVTFVIILFILRKITSIFYM